MGLIGRLHAVTMTEGGWFLLLSQTPKGIYHLTAMPALQCQPILNSVHNHAEAVERGSGREGRS